MSYIHVSFDEVEEFIPRVPKYKLPEENNKISRICVSDSIQRGLSSIPGIKEISENLYTYEYEPILHVYYLEPQENGFLSTEEIEDYVDDVSFYRESWLTKSPKKVRRIDYRWKDPYVDLNYDGLYYQLVQGKFERVKRTDGISDFLNDLGVTEEIREGLYKIIKGVGLRTFLTHSDKSFVLIIRGYKEYQEALKDGKTDLTLEDFL